MFSCGDTAIEDPNTQGDRYEKIPAKDPIVLAGDIVVNQGQTFSYDTKTHFATNVSTGYTFLKQSGPGFAVVNATTGLVTGEPVTDFGLFTNLKVRATKTSDSSTVDSSTMTIAVNGDPVRSYAWHLKNTGQSSFATFGGVTGVDVNVYDVLKAGITGDGVKIAVSDSGVEYEHDDLHLNALAGQHRNYSLSSPYISDPTPTGFHGTAVTGIINAMGWNGYGSIGIAPKAKFAGFQFLDSPQTTSIMIHQTTGNFDIFNYSYGDFVFNDTVSDASYVDQLRFKTITENKVYVKAAGNEFISLGTGGICASHNANFPFENESPFIIIVGAIHADGGKSSYSNAGSNIWVVAPGGENGESQGPAIISTDLPSCFKGQSIAGTYSSNDFEYGHSLNPKCDYTATMNGTSSATPMVSGVIALMREAQPALKMRDIKHILANSSVKVDPTHSTILNSYGKNHPSNASFVGNPCPVDLDLAGHDYEQGWITNAAGYDFNNFYGFGLVDAKAAVTMAQGYAFPLGTLTELNKDFNVGAYSNSPSLAITDNNKDGATDSINIAANLTIESIQVKVNVTHTMSGQVGVELTGPNGAHHSILMNINNSFLFDNDANLNIVLTTNAFYGEPSAGNWTIKVIDGKAGNTGTLNKWDINILGH